MWRGLNGENIVGVLLLACLLPTQTTSKVVPVKLFFLDDADHSTWCVYANESSWKDAVEKTGADNVATAEIADFKAITIQFTQSDETGDWMVFDEYTVGRDDSMVGLSRRINVLPADRTIEENTRFKRRSGQDEQCDEVSYHQQNTTERRPLEPRSAGPKTSAGFSVCHVNSL